MNMSAIYDTAETYLGLEEFPGAKHNPKIVKMFADTGNAWANSDEIPWCAAFVGSVLAQCGITGTGRLDARSYANWGQKVDLKDAQPGDVVVLSRDPDPKAGHVGFYAGKGRNGFVRLLGGNQGNKVSVAEFPVKRVIAVRRAKVTVPDAPKPAPEKKPLTQSTTMQASAVQMATAAGGGLAAVGALDGNAQIIALVMLAVIFGAAAWIMRERIRKWVAEA